MTYNELYKLLHLAIFKDIKLWSNNNYNLSIFKCIKNHFTHLKNPSELFYLLENKDNLNKIHLFCSVCGKKNKYINSTLGYSYHCSVKCSNSDPKKKLVTEQNNLKKYGVRHTFQSDNNKQKSEITMLKKYGTKHFTNPEKAKITRLNDIDENGLNSYERSVIKTINTGKNNIDKNGNNSFKRGSIKAQNTKEIRYGNKNYTNLEKHKKTCFERYNDEGYTNRKKAKETLLNDIDSNGLNGYQRAYKKVEHTKILKYGDKNYNNRKKAQNTCLIKYNNKTFLGSKNHLELYKNPEFIKENQLKKYDTRKRNHTFNTSKYEELLFNKLKSKFTDAIHHYSSDQRYPFECDFYVPSKDLFIELHFSQFHQGKPFDTNSKQDWIKLLCLELNATRINKLENNRKNQYENMIYTWTNLDVKKLETFKKKKLNHKIFYTETEFNKWLEKNNAL